MEHRERRTLRRALLLGDLLLLALAVAVAFGVHALLRGQLSVLRTPPSFGSYAALGWSLVPVWVALIVALGLDRSLETDADWTETAARLLGLHLLALVAIALMAFLTQAVINRSIVALFLGTSFLLMLLERRLLARWLRHQHATGQERARLLLGRRGAASPLGVRGRGSPSTGASRGSLAPRLGRASCSRAPRLRVTGTWLRCRHRRLPGRWPGSLGSRSRR